MGGGEGVILTKRSLQNSFSGVKMTPDMEELRVSPWVHQAGVLHAISPISMKLGQFKGSTPKLKMTN